MNTEPRPMPERTQVTGHAALEQRPETARATVLGQLPGTNMVETVTMLRGELGAPHRGVLPILAARSDVAHPVPRTATVLTDLWTDLQPHGWRLTRHDGKESRAAAALVASDVNVLADVLGAETDGDRGPVVVELLGPMSLAASLHLHNGEKVLLDHGARRDVAEALADGVGSHLRSVRDSADGRPIVLRLREPDLARVLNGEVPTASGYRTLRAVPKHEVDRAVELLAESARAAGAVETELVLPDGVDPRHHAGGAVDRLYLAHPGSAAEDWEPIAAVVENDVRIGLLLPALTRGGSDRFVPVGRLVESVARPWTDLGLRAQLLDQVTVAPDAGLEAHAPHEVRRATERATDLAHALHEVALDA